MTRPCKASQGLIGLKAFSHFVSFISPPIGERPTDATREAQALQKLEGQGQSQGQGGPIWDPRAYEVQASLKKQRRKALKGPLKGLEKAFEKLLKAF